MPNQYLSAQELTDVRATWSRCNEAAGSAHAHDRSGDHCAAGTTPCVCGKGRRASKGFFSTVDHKQIGIRYIVTAFVFLALGGVEALIMRLQLAGPDRTLLTPDQYNQLFSTHGMTMIFLYASPILSGFSNYLWPLLLGSRDMAFPRLNALSYWIYLASGHLSLCRVSHRQRSQRRLVQLRAVCVARLQPGTERGFLFARNGVPRASRRRSARPISSSPPFARARRACRSIDCRSWSGAR